MAKAALVLVTKEVQRHKKSSDDAAEVQRIMVESKIEAPEVTLVKLQRILAKYANEPPLAYLASIPISRGVLQLPPGLLPVCSTNCLSVTSAQFDECKQIFFFKGLTVAIHCFSASDTFTLTEVAEDDIIYTSTVAYCIDNIGNSAASGADALTFDGFTITKIYKVENQVLEAQYEAQLGHIVKRKPSSKTWDRWLFHGTDATSIRAICNEGFNRSLSGCHGSRTLRCVFLAIPLLLHLCISPPLQGHFTVTGSTLPLRRP